MYRAKANGAWPAFQGMDNLDVYSTTITAPVKGTRVRAKDISVTGHAFYGANCWVD